jgi:hypothetical protein
MTVSTQVFSNQYAGNGATDEFDYDFTIYDSDELIVSLIDADGVATVQTLTTDYSIDGVGEPGGGSIEFATAPAAGLTVDIRPVYELLQTTSIRNQGRFLPEVHETAFDRQVSHSQYLRRLIGTTLRIADSEAADVPTLGDVETRKGKFPFFDASTGALTLAASLSGTALTQGLFDSFLEDASQSVFDGLLSGSDELILAQLLFRLTQREIDNSITPVNFISSDGRPLPEGHLIRYGTNTTPGTTNMEPAFTAAIALKMHVIVPVGVYRHNGQLAQITEGGLIGEQWRSASGSTRSAQIVFYNITGATQAAVRIAYSAANPLGQRRLENLFLLASSWDNVTGANGDGVDVTGAVTMRNVFIQGFERYGLFLHNTASDGEAPYDSILEQVRTEYTGQHGIVIGTGANTVTLINCGGKYAGSTAYLTAPVSAGNYDGVHLDYQNAGNPSAAFFSFVPDGVKIIGGDSSYNSRYGWNFIACQSGTFFPSYAEGNLQAAPGQVNLGSGLTNCFFVLDGIAGRTAGVNFGMIGSGTELGGNRVFVGGRDCGSGESNTETSRSNMSMARKISYVGHNNDFSNAANISGSNTGIANLNAAGTGYWNLTSALRFNAVQVLAARRTGWTAPTGASSKATYDTATVTLPNLAGRVMALIEDLIAHGIIGA